MTLGVGAILSAEPADLVRKLTFATKEAASPEHEDLFMAMARVNLAHAIMLHELGLASKTVTVALVRLMKEIFEKGPQSVPLKAEAGDLYPQIESYAASCLGGETAGFLQLGRSRGDVIPSAMRLKLRIKEMRLLRAQLALRRTLLDVAGKHVDDPMPAYTHWQQSQVMTVGHFLGRFCAWFERDTERLLQTVSMHNQSVLGSANGVGTSVKVDRELTSSLLGHEAPTVSSGDGTNAWDYMIEPVADAALFSSHLARMMGNFILWHTQEFGMVSLSDSFATASTYLPHKKNPEPLETVKVFAEQIQGHLATVYLMARNEDWPHSLINHGYLQMNQALDLGVDAAELTKAILQDITFDTDRMLALVSNSFATASEVANTLVVQCGISFRDAHEIVGSAVRECMGRSERTLSVQSVRKAAENHGVRLGNITDDEINAAMDSAGFVGRMESLGGVAPEQFHRSLVHWKEQLDHDAQRVSSLQSRFDNADREMMSRAGKIVQAR